MSAITIYLRKDYKRTDGKKPVYCMTSIKENPVRFNTKVSVLEEDWDEDKHCIKGKTKEVKDLNLLISDCYSRINDILVRYRLMGRDITPEILRKEYDKPTAFLDFYAFMEATIKQKDGVSAEGTIKTHNTLLHKLQDYRKELMFSDITHEFLADFTKHMKVKLKNNPNTVAKMLRVLRIYLNEAVRQGKIAEMPLKIKVKNIAVDRMFLDPEELETAMEAYKNKRFDGVHYKALQAFLFSCFTGLRISDVREVRMEHIQKNILVFTPVKTTNMMKTVKVPLSKPAKLILNDVAPNRLYGNIFKMEADQTINKRLKDIFKQLKIEKNISFHCARHTFATVFLRSNPNMAILQKLLGHASITETMKYVHVISDDVESAVSLFDRFA